MATQTDMRAIVRERLDALLSAWARADLNTISTMLCDDVVFASPFTEPLDADGFTRGRHNVLSRLTLERLNFFEAMEIVDVLVGSQSMVVLLQCGAIKLSCMIEMDEEARFRRMIASMGHTRPH